MTLKALVGQQSGDLPFEQLLALIHQLTAQLVGPVPALKFC